MKLKYLVAALGLVASAASQASIVVPDAFGNGEIALVVYDNNASYTLDLGVTYSQFLASAGSSATLATLTSANWSTFVSNETGNDWNYAVISAKSNNGGNNASILSTISADYVGVVADNFDSSAVQGGVAQVSTFFSNVSATGTHKTTANGDSYNVAGTPAYYLNSGMDTFNGVLYTNNSLVGTAMAVDLVQRNQSSGSAPTETTLAGLMNLTQVNGNYVLSYNVAAVPEAPGITLLAAGLGLLGLVSARRRNNRG